MGAVFRTLFFVGDYCTRHGARHCQKRTDFSGEGVSVCHLMGDRLEDHLER